MLPLVFAFTHEWKYNLTEVFEKDSFWLWVCLEYLCILSIIVFPSLIIQNMKHFPF